MVPNTWLLGNPVLQISHIHKPTHKLHLLNVQSVACLVPLNLSPHSTEGFAVAFEWADLKKEVSDSHIKKRKVKGND